MAIAILADGPACFGSSLPLNWNGHNKMAFPLKPFKFFPGLQSRFEGNAPSQNHIKLPHPHALRASRYSNSLYCFGSTLLVNSSSTKQETRLGWKILNLIALIAPQSLP